MGVDAAVDAVRGGKAGWLVSGSWDLVGECSELADRSAGRAAVRRRRRRRGLGGGAGVGAQFRAWEEAGPARQSGGTVLFPRPPGSGPTSVAIGRPLRAAVRFQGWLRAVVSDRRERWRGRCCGVRGRWGRRGPGARAWSALIAVGQIAGVPPHLYPGW